MILTGNFLTVLLKCRTKVPVKLKRSAISSQRNKIINADEQSQVHTVGLLYAFYIIIIINLAPVAIFSEVW